MVTLISLIHQAVETKVKTNFMGRPVIKRYVEHDYNIRMGRVDLSDNFLSHYQTLKSIKWYRKLLVHLINMTTLNAHILNKKYGVQKMSHCAYKEYIAKYLITTSVESATCLKKKPSIEIDNSHLWLAGKHFVRKFTTVPGSKRKCSVCNFTCQQLARMGHNDLNLQVRYSSYGCTVCSQVTLLLDSMFRNISFESKLQTVGSRKQDLQNSVSLEIIHNSLLPENVYYIFAKKFMSKYSLHK